MSQFPSFYEEFIYKSRYARYIPSEGRRENWDETVDRYINYMCSHVAKKHNFKVSAKDKKDLREAILGFKIMPSMRCLMTAGPALEKNQVAGYNCSYLPINGHGITKDIYVEEYDTNVSLSLKNPVDFDELMYILMCGTGVGFSVERQFTNKLPTVGKNLSRNQCKPFKKNYPNVDKKELSSYDAKENIVYVADSREGWASALRMFIFELYNANFDVQYDVSALRPAGARLKTFGGRSSGPAPLVELFEFTREIFKGANGRKLTSLECHDLCCKIGDVVVVGGVRRSALISLSNLSDDRMRRAKYGDWYNKFPWRRLANNSVCYSERPDMGAFMREFETIFSSFSGERGIFNRQAAVNTAKRNGRRETSHDFGTNPCSEIILRPFQFCNLSEVVIRHDDSFDALLEKVRLATILGTLQSTLTDFKYLRSIWKKNTEEERLLGVSLTGIMDHAVMSGDEQYGTDIFPPLKDALIVLRDMAIDTNKEWAKKIGIPQSAAITCVKPSGTVSQLVNSSSGIHPRYSPYYMRNVRADNKDPLTQYMKDIGVPYEPETGNSEVTIFSFPVASPPTAIHREMCRARNQLDVWFAYARNWCEHKPSATVYVRDDEWMGVGHWVYENFDICSGISFLPYDGGVYKQAPYVPITKEEYEKALSEFPKDLNFEGLPNFEKVDSTKGVHDLACSGNACEIVDITGAEDG